MGQLQILRPEISTGVKTYDNLLAGYKGGFSLESIKGYIENLRETRAAATVRTTKAAFKKHLSKQTASYKDRAVLEQVFKDIKTPIPERKVHRETTLTPAEIKALLKDQPTKRKALMFFLLNTGVRISEALSIKLTDCQDIGGNVYITIIGKGSKERRVILPGKMFNKIREAYNGRVYLFGNNGKKISRQYAYRTIKAGGKKAGIAKPIHPHTFRHTWASISLNNGVNLAAVSSYLGHSSTSVTADCYIHSEITPGQVIITEGVA